MQNLAVVLRSELIYTLPLRHPQNYPLCCSRCMTLGVMY
jgi:hypothetical protein